MKKLNSNSNSNSTLDNFEQFILATEEMICIRGGEDTPRTIIQPPLHV